MKEIQATIYKEYKETRVYTLVFFLLGTIFPFVVYALGQVHYYSQFSFKEYVGTVPFGGLFAVWLNALCLSSCAFAREHENKTFEILRRVSNDWRLVAVGKFAYVVFVTTLLALFYVVESLVFDRFYEMRLGTTLFQTFEWTFVPNFFSSTLLFGIVEVFVWGAFWTARCRRQTTALFATLLTSLFFMGVATRLAWLIPSDGIDELPYATLARILVLLVLLPFVPGKFRFGFLEKTTDETSARESEPNAKQVSYEWNVVKLNQPSSFGALLRFVAGNASLLGRGFLELLVEFAIFVVAVSGILRYVMDDYAREHWSGICSIYVFLLFFCYFVVFASGMFRTSKKQDLETLTRLDVSPFSYWLANIIVYGLYGLALTVAYVGLGGLNYFGDGWNDVLGVFALLRMLLFFNIPTLTLVALVFSAAEPGSRLVVWGRSLLYLILCGLGFRLPNLAYGSLHLFDDSLDVASQAWIWGHNFAIGITALSFFIASYYLVRNRMLCRQTKAPWFVPWGIALFMAVAIFVFENAIVAQNQVSNSPEVVEEVTLDLPQKNLLTPNEYIKQQETINEKKFETILSQRAPLYDDEVAIRRQADKTLNYVASTNAAAEAEANFYTSALKSDLNRNYDQIHNGNDLLKLLEELPSLRPDNKTYATNAYTYAQLGTLDDAYYSPYSAQLTKLRKRYKKEWENAALNVYRQTSELQTLRGAFFDLTAKDEFVDLTKIHSGSEARYRFETLQKGAIGRLTYSNEFIRNLFILSAAANAYYEKNNLFPRSFQEIRDAEILSSDYVPLFVQFEPLYSASGEEHAVKKIDGKEVALNHSLKLPEHWKLDLEKLHVVQFVSATKVVEDPEFVKLEKDGTLYATRPIVAVVVSGVKLLDDPQACVFLIVKPIGN